MITGIDLSKYNKICIIGAPGAGKTYFTMHLAQELGRPIISLDEIRFSKRRRYGAELPAAQCATQLNAAMARHKKYIVEGTAYQPWTEPAIATADIVIIVHRSGIVRSWRIFRRWIFDNEYHRSIGDTLRLIKISLKWYQVRYPVIRQRIVSSGRLFVMIRPRNIK